VGVNYIELFAIEYVQNAMAQKTHHAHFTETGDAALDHALVESGLEGRTPIGDAIDHSFGGRGIVHIVQRAGHYLRKQSDVLLSRYQAVAPHTVSTQEWMRMVQHMQHAPRRRAGRGSCR
jgi:hypothetical protein